MSKSELNSAIDVVIEGMEQMGGNLIMEDANTGNTFVFDVPGCPIPIKLTVEVVED